METWTNFHATMERKVENLDERLEALRVRAGRIQKRKMAREHKELELLDRQRDAIREDMLELKTSGGTGWEALRNNLNDAVQELEEGIDDLFDQFSESDQEER
jgi:hypothetical protein